MKRFFKTMLSMLIVVVMLAQVFPVQLFVTPVEAASDGQQYKYVLVTNPTPGKTYLLANAGSGASSAYIAGVADGTAEGSAITSKSVAVSSGVISEFDGVENYEWTILKGEPAANNGTQFGSATFMFQNIGTNAYLYNPVYDVGHGDNNLGSMFVTYDPLHDNYPASTRIIFDSKVAYNKYVDGLNLTNATQQTGWLELMSSANNSDVQANINLYDFPATTYSSLSMVYHPVNVTGSSTISRIYTDTSTYPGPTKNYSFRWTTGTDNWVGVYGRLYSSASNSFTWDGSCVWTGNADYIRFDYRDPGKSGDGIYLDSIIFHQNTGSAEVTSFRREVSSWYGKSGGFYPSHRFQNTQFANLTSTKLTSGLVLCSSGATHAASSGNYAHYQYYYGWSGSSLKRYYQNSSLGGIYYYEKQFATSEGVYTWELVTEQSQLTSDGEYVIANRKTTATEIFTDGGSSTDNGMNLTYVEGFSFNDGTSGTAVSFPENAIWRIRKIGTSSDDSDFYFYIQNAATGNVMYNYQATSDGVNSGSAILKTMAQAATGYNILYGQRYVWQYDFTVESLYAYSIAQNQGETPTSSQIGYNTTNTTAELNNTCYLYKKTYCPHNNTVVKSDTQPTCTTDGLYWVYCNDCSCDVEKTVRPALDHNYTTNKVDATCTTAGYTTYTCSRCGDSYIADHVAALGHAEQTVPGTPATCNSTGLTDGKKCSRCGITLVEQTTIPKLEHDWQVTSTEGTCGQVGVTNYTCSLCGETKREEGAVIQHLYDQVVVTNPTCTTEGYTTHTCSKCGDSYTDTPVAALGHSYGSWYTVTHATTTSDGLERRDCTRCDHYETQIIPMLESAKLKGSEVTTEPGETVTIDVELRGNPGIWGMNFVVYWPEALTFVKAESSDEAFPLGDIEGNENAPVDPTTNGRMAAYFADANIPNPGNYMAFAYYVDNGRFENNYNNGKIISITFTLPADNCLKEYPIGLFGVYASSGNDVINADGDTVADFSYIDGKIIVPNGIDCPHTDYTVVTDKAATCTTDGARHKVCNNCGYEFDHETVQATGHSYGEPVLIREPSGLSAGIMRQTCTKCGHYIDTEVLDKPATGEGISASVNAETYKYHWTTRIYPGREYMILSNQKNGDTNTAYAMGLNENGEIVSTLVTFDSDGKVVNSDDSLVWSTATGIGLNNNRYGKWLASSLVSYDNTSADDNYSNNVYVSDTPYGDEKYTSFTSTYLDKITSNPIFNEAHMYLGFGDLTNDVAHPSDQYLRIGSYAALKTNGSSTIYTSSEMDWFMEFDYSFGSSSTWLEIFRDDDLASVEESGHHVTTDFGVRIEPGKVSVYRPAYEGGANDIYGYVSGTEYTLNVDNKVVVAEQTYITGEEGGHNYDFTHWHHFKVDYIDGVLRIFVDGLELTGLRQTNYPLTPQRLFFFNTPNRTVGIDNLFVKAGHCYQPSEGSAWVYNDPEQYTVYIHEDFSGDIYNFSGSYWDFYGSTSAEKVIDGSHGEDIITLKTNTFFASENDENLVFLYEKRLDNEMSTIYQLADGLEGGEAYVLVKANQAGETTLLSAATATKTNVTVYEDGVSIAPDAETYLPYIDLFEIGGTRNFYDNSVSSDNDFKNGYASAHEFFVTETDGGFLLNYVPANVQENDTAAGSFLTTNGKLTADPTDANIINVVDGKVTIAGEEYYVYKKVCVDLIDTAYENDMAVVDFGFGFNLGADFFRDNDPWADRVDVTLTGIAASIGAQKNEWFYPAGTRVGGAGNSATVANGTATFNGGISFTNSGKYESIVTVDYEGKVEHLGAYMYSTLYIIPATSVYYEDNASFITYTSSNNVADGRGAWETVAGDSPVVDVLDAQYGNSTTHSSYLQYSGNSVHKVAVGPSNVPGDYADGWMPSASFTFTGTGFDVISAIGRTTCAVFVEITGATEEYYVVDNYLGYTYDETEDKWVATTGDNAVQLYQVPVIKWESKSDVPAAYNVKISVAYDKFFDHAGVGYSEFYLDGIRVYNPVDITKAENEVALNKYMEDNELIISEDNLRRLLITNASEQLENGQTLSGALFIDGANLTNTTNDFANYNEVGAANEITLTAASGIAFTVTSDSQPAKVALGIKVSNGGAASVLVSSGAKSTTIATATATDMYYDITEGVEWKQSAGKYSANIVITNSSASALVSLTNLKLTTGAAEPVSVEYSVSTKTENIAYRTLASLYGVNGEEFVVGDVYDTKTVNGLDTLTLKKYLTGNATLDAREYAAADINGDGVVNAMDALLLRKLMMN